MKFNPYKGDERTKRMTISDMVGKIPTAIVNDENVGTLTFTFSDGSAGQFCHIQDCCENVYIDDINGDFDDLLNTPLLVADERVSRDQPEGHTTPKDDYEESQTWTFYTFRSIKGSVDVRWFGSSNGYYSETVDLIWELPA